MNINSIPNLDFDVGVVDSDLQDSTVGGVCVIVGIVAGVMINQQQEVLA